MKVLIVAHPDDEVLWFNPEDFDRIIIVFGDFGDGRSGDGRRKALKEHPLADRITHLDFKQSNRWRDKSKVSEYEDAYRRTCKFLANLQADEVVTHNAMGEYQAIHRYGDHIMIHNACMATLNCSVNGKDPAMYRKIKQVYMNNGCWTWY